MAGRRASENESILRPWSAPRSKRLKKRKEKQFRKVVRIKSAALTVAA